MGFFDFLRTPFGLGSSGNNFNRWTMGFFNTTPIFNTYARDIEKVQAILANPAMLKVVALQCDLFSLGRIIVKDKSGKELPDDPAKKLLDNPNPLQSRTQFLWDFMFWNMIGNDYCYVDSNAADKVNNKLYFLEAQKLEWPTWMQQNSDKLIFSTSALNTIMSQSLKYRYNDGSSIDIQLSKIICMSDLTNGIGNFFKGPSRIDALYKIISNSDAALDAKNINVRYSGKFMVAGKQDPNNVEELPMSEPEKKDIEQKINAEGHPVTANKSLIEIKRFVENIGNLKLDESFLSDYFMIGTMFGIPRDVLEANVSATYENQEKARGAHVSYTLQPKGDDFCAALMKRFGYDLEGKTIYISWDHLPFMEVFNLDNANVEKLKSISFANFLNSGVSLDEVNQYLGTSFKTGERNYVKTDGALKPASGIVQLPPADTTDKKPAK
jgi:hypothetical protein